MRATRAMFLISFIFVQLLCQAGAGKSKGPKDPKAAKCKSKMPKKTKGTKEMKSKTPKKSKSPKKIMGPKKGKGAKKSKSPKGGCTEPTSSPTSTPGIPAPTRMPSTSPSMMPSAPPSDRCRRCLDTETEVKTALESGMDAVLCETTVAISDKIDVTGMPTLSCCSDVDGACELRESSTFDKNALISVDGGAISLTVENVRFTSDGGTGRAIKVENGGELTVRHSEFIGIGRAGDNNGGAISVIAATLTVENSTFTNNTAVNGGAIHLDDGSTGAISDSRFQFNKATGKGGAIDVQDGASLTITGSTISRNEAADNGGGINVDEATLTISDATVTLNKSTSGDGGAIAVTGTSTVMDTDSAYAQNEAVNGGALFASDKNNGAERPALTISGSTYQSNTATDDGGGLYLENIQASTLDDVTIQMNSADRGGGIFLREKESGTTTLSISTSTIDSNTSSGSGPNIRVNANSAGDTVDLECCGGAISLPTTNTGSGTITGTCDNNPC